MNKGKIKKQQKKHLSIVLVPHSSEKVKVLKFTALYTKIASVFVIVLTVFICAGIFVFNSIEENKRLKVSIAQLYDSNIEQRNLLAEKINEIENLQSRDELINKQIKDIATKYREITENYISGRMEGSISSRSGDRNDRAFADDVKELNTLLNNLNAINESQNSDLVDLSEIENKLKIYLDSVPTLWPTESTRITDNFGYRKHPITRKRTFHEGIDIGAPYGQPIKAAASGKVTFAGSKSGYGYVVFLDHGGGISTVYGHASKLLVKQGQTVKKGDVIAKVGSTGVSTGPHLHFEVRLYNTPVDPIKYLDKK